MPSDISAIGEQIRESLGQDRVGVALTLLREMLAADQGVFLARVRRAEQRSLVALLPTNELSDILDETPTDAAVAIVRELPAKRAAELLDDVDSHTVADILLELPESGAAAIVAGLHRPQDVVPLLQYPPDTAGGMMTLDFPRVRQYITAGNSLDALRLFGEDAEGFGWVCVLDDERRLVGAVSITQLALSSPARLAGELADRHGHRLVSVSPDTDREDAHGLMSRYSMGIIPVVDESRRVLGVIRAEEAMQIGEEEAEEDMLRIASAPGERVFGPLHLSNPAA